MFNEKEWGLGCNVMMISSSTRILIDLFHRLFRSRFVSLFSSVTKTKMHFKLITTFVQFAFCTVPEIFCLDAAS